MVHRNCVYWTDDNATITTISTVLSEPRGMYTNLSYGYDKILSKYAAYQASLALYHYLLPCIIVLGTASNVLSFVVMTSKKLKNNSTCIFLAVLAVFDTLVLYISGARYWFGKVTTVDLKLLNDPMCKIFGGFLYHFVRHVSVWIVIAVNVDRFMLITFPVWTHKIHPRRRALVGIFVVMAAMFVVDVTTFWSYELIEDCVFKDGDTSQRATQVRCYTNVLRSSWSWVDLCIYSFIPITLLLGLNLRLMCALIKREKDKHEADERKSPGEPLKESEKTPETSDSASGLLGDRVGHQSVEDRHEKHQDAVRASAESNKKKKHKHSKKATFFSKISMQYNTSGDKHHKRFTIALPLIVSVSFIVCSTPITVIEILYAKNHELDARDTANVRLIRTLFFMLMYLNHSVNLFLYCIAGTTFRRELVALFKRCCCRRASSVL